MSKGRSGAIRVGVGGWTFPPWRGPFYPAKLPQKCELPYAARHLTSIEVNGTYYRTQTPETFAAWREATPDDFVFSLKAPRFTTNRRVLAEAGPGIERFLGSGVTELGHKLGVINWQFMPTKKFDPTDFAAFLKLLPERIDGRELRHALEVRHESFRSPEFVGMARDRQVAIVLAGDSEYPAIPDTTADFAYVRIMGTREAEATGYPPAALDLWARRVKALARGASPAGARQVTARKADGVARDVFLYVISGAKVRNPAAAMALLGRLR